MNTTLLDGLRIVEYLAHADEPQALTGIAKALALGNSKTHRLLQTLIQTHYVYQNYDSKYVASTKFWMLGSAILRHVTLKIAAENEMQRLMEETGESVHLSILEKSEIVYLHKIDSDNPVRSYSQIGGRMPAPLVATGKAMLAYQDEATLRHMHHSFAGAGLTRMKTVTALLKEMQAIRASRVAVNRGEWRKEVYGVASPIIDHTGQVIAAIGVSGPAHRFKTRRLSLLSIEVKDAAGRIEQKLFGESANRLWTA